MTLDSVVQPRKDFKLPKIVVMQDTYQLADLIKSNFPMAESDNAFKLTMEELIKCTSILLYKFNLEA